MKNVNLMSKLYIVLTLFFASPFIAIAGDNSADIPEPSILSLFLVVGVVAYIMKKRNK
ncbi:PEP-CTERM sorting domain-containing protein [Colwellia psychrerythraea]|uniref:PEP motif putative anchor domain protein n=1 Tax=Colwellia psychrerythraea TaxID=28229 RepID=A0A099KUR8_COLPS|nr:PEP-CTERM sorting domain-containing protein [Colwellia psychrerythraea]KGJ93940.1 PEP motif putative anchor domain protein [Colwellia psychrerythraea]